MHRKILGICMALVALGALAIGPTSASAFNLHLTDTNGANTEALAPGAKLLAIGETNEVSTFVAGETTVECNENTMTGTVHTNTTTGGIVKGDITYASFDSHLNASGTDCRKPGLFGNEPVRVTIPVLEGGGGSWCIQATSKTTFSLTGRGCTDTTSVPTLTFKLDFTSIGLVCEYTREANVNGSLTNPTTHEASTLSVTGEPVFTYEGTNGLCPASGKITNMKFRTYTDKVAANTTSYDDATSTANPVWAAE